MHITETEVEIIDSSYEDDTPKQDEENKETLCQDSLSKDSLAHGNSNHILLDKFVLVKSAMDDNCIFESLNLATTGDIIRHKNTIKLIYNSMDTNKKLFSYWEGTKFNDYQDKIKVERNMGYSY